MDLDIPETTLAVENTVQGVRKSDNEILQGQPRGTRLKLNCLGKGENRDVKTWRT